MKRPNQVHYEMTPFVIFNSKEIKISKHSQQVLYKGFWDTKIKSMLTSFAKATESSMCPFHTCKPPTFSMHETMWPKVWNSSPNNLVASYLSTSFFRLTTSYQSSTSQWHVKLLSTSRAPIFKLLWSIKNPIKHKPWHIYFFSFPMCCNIGYFSIKFVVPNTYQSKTPFD